MGAAGVILAINLSVAGAFLAAFAWISFYVAAREPARWFAATFFLGMAYYGCEALVPLTPYPRLFVFAGFSVFLLALALSCIGVARLYGLAVPWHLLTAIVAFSLPLNVLIYDMPRNSFLRVFLYQLPYALLQATAAAMVLRAQVRRRLDWLLFAAFAGGSLHFVSKAALAAMLGTGSSAQTYLDSSYALISQATGAVLLVGMGLLMLAILVRDILSDATEKSERDSLTGLLNRRGFEERARIAARAMIRSGMPAAIVICDLDHFKSVNDTYGHAGGDRVLIVFAATLEEAASPEHVVARIGGEEFAVLLPGSNAAAARLFAETVRAGFEAVPVAGMPPGLRFTASFGVAELEVGDTMSDMLRRADAALYQAKASGRNCVRVADGVIASLDDARRALRTRRP